MARKGPTAKRTIAPDPVFGSRLVQRIINKLMRGGKKSTAERIFYSAMEMVADRSGENPLDVLVQALRNVTPAVEVRSRRVGGATYQVPIEVRAERRIALPIRWIIDNARQRGEKTMAERLAAELLEASRGQGASVKKREDTHKMAEANKAFAHYRW